MIQLCPEFVVSKQKKGDDCNPDLRHNCIFAGTQKGFYLEILLDPFEKQLYLPPVAVDIGNGLR